MDEAEETGNSISGPFSEQYENLTIDEAYNIQLSRINKYLKAGKEVTGKKIGLTSKAMQDLLKVNEPDYGHLLDMMDVSKNESISVKKLFEPKVEGEIAFVLNEDLEGPNLTIDDVMEATDYMIAAIEIVDSRIKDWNIKIEDTIADNASSGLYVLSDKRIKLTKEQLENEEMKLFKNGTEINRGIGSDVIENPANAVAWLGNTLHKYDVKLKKGEVILSGAISAAVSVQAGDEFSVEFSTLGSLKVSFTE